MDKDGSCKCPLAPAALSWVFFRVLRVTVILWDVVCTYLVTCEANSGHSTYNFLGVVNLSGYKFMSF